MFEFFASLVKKLFEEARWMRFYKNVEIILPNGEIMSWEEKVAADRLGEYQARLRRNYGAKTGGRLCGIDFSGEKGKGIAAKVFPLPERNSGR